MFHLFSEPLPPCFQTALSNYKIYKINMWTFYVSAELEPLSGPPKKLCHLKLKKRECTLQTNAYQHFVWKKLFYLPPDKEVIEQAGFLFVVFASVVFFKKFWASFWITDFSWRMKSIVFNLLAIWYSQPSLYCDPRYCGMFFLNQVKTKSINTSIERRF